MAVNCAARMASHAGMMMREESVRACGLIQAATISGMVYASDSRTLRAMKSVSSARPQAPEPSHQKAGAPHLPGEPRHAYGGGTADAGRRQRKARAPRARGAAVDEKRGRAARMTGVQHAEREQQRGVKAEYQHEYGLPLLSKAGEPP